MYEDANWTDADGKPRVGLHMDIIEDGDTSYGTVTVFHQDGTSEEISRTNMSNPAGELVMGILFEGLRWYSESCGAQIIEVPSAGKRN